MNILLIILSSFYTIHFIITFIVLTVEVIKERKEIKLKDALYVYLLMIPITLLITIIYDKTFHKKVKEKLYWRDKYYEIQKEIK